jgi:putative membrane protein
MAHNRTDTGEAWKGMVAGLLGGLVASWVMEQFQFVWSNLSEISTPSAGKESGSSDDEDSTMKGAEKIAETIFHTRLSKEERKKAGPMLHYALGASLSSVYGALAEFQPGVSAGCGLPYGAFVWLFMDEIGVPLLSLSKPSWEYPLSNHAYALASHFIYGSTTELVRRIVRNVL